MSVVEVRDVPKGDMVEEALASPVTFVEVVCSNFIAVVDTLLLFVANGRPKDGCDVACIDDEDNCEEEENV